MSAADFFHLDEDLPLLVAALAERGIHAEIVDWHDPSVDWSSFVAAVLRSPWDYTWQLGRFLAWAQDVAAVTRLLNPLAVLPWNTDKRYLLDLERLGVPIVPTRVVEPGHPVAPALVEVAELAAELTGASSDGEVVVKPVVSAGGRDTERFAIADHPAITAHAERLLTEGRAVLVQPYVSSVDLHGEVSVVYVGDRVTHGFRKGPILVPGVGFVEGAYREERISSHEPTAAEIAVAEQALDAVEECVARCSRRDLLYARVDLVTDRFGQLRVLELELVEPSLFLAHRPDAVAPVADGFAVAVRAAHS